MVMKRGVDKVSKVERGAVTPHKLDSQKIFTIVA